MSPHSGEHIIYTFCGKVLDVCECKIKKDSQVFQYTFNAGDNQLWRITDRL
jgi:capsule polysaccharide modification protein KpsS